VADRVAIDSYREIIGYLANNDPTTRRRRKAFSRWKRNTLMISSVYWKNSVVTEKVVSIFTAGLADCLGVVTYRGSGMWPRIPLSLGPVEP
jgi:hypothetical protein